MKRIILETKSEEVHYTRITDQSYVGYMTNDTHKFMALKTHGQIIPVGSSNFLDNSKSVFMDMQHLVKNQYKAYEFSSFEDLIKWLIE